MNQKKKQWSLYAKALLVLLSAQILWIAPFWFFTQKTAKRSSPKKQVVLHIFIHGTFGSSLGLLSFFPVIHDNFKGSHYVKTTRLMRKDPYFYKDQPMLERGLIKVNPTYEFVKTDTHKKIAYPLIRGYEEVYNFVKNKNHESYFYTFGWSGLLSKQRRRQEALRLYNGLHQEIEYYTRQGYATKIVIIAHSHGGNIALNLAGINKALKILTEPTKALSALPQELKDLCAYLNTCRTLNTRTETGHKQFDFFPKKSSLKIDTLFLLGTPIQPETDHYAADLETFKKVYNFYSDNDPVQKMDWVSTSRYYSEQRFNRLPSSCPSITQIKITYDRLKNEQDSFFFPFLQQKSYTFDPAHRDFWFIAHENEPIHRSFLYPLPLFVLCPLLNAVIKKQPSNDIVINISQMHNNLRCTATEYTKETYLHSESIPLTFINRLQKNLIPWQPDQACRKQEFDIIARHVKKAIQQSN